MTATFTVERDHAGSGTVLLDIAGQLDLAARAPLVEHLDRLLADEAVRSVVIDLDRVDFVDSTGIGALVGGRLAADRTGRVLRVRGVRGQVAEVFTLTGVTAILTVEGPA